MIELVYGGSGSGKSAFAESEAVNKSSGCRYYLATMNSSDDESKKRIRRHQELRKGKGFFTIEAPYDIGEASSRIEKDSTVLLECLSNLVANEMFRGGNIIGIDAVVEKVFKDIKEVERNCSSLIIVSNNIFEDGTEYDEVTRNYMKALAVLNIKLAEEADVFYEVVSGNPCRIK